MSYRYQVEFTRECGTMSVVRTYKFNNFSDAFDNFVIGVNNKPSDKSLISWSVVLYDMELCDIKMKVDNTDFE